MEGPTMLNFLLGAMFTINLALVGAIWATLSTRLGRVEAKAGALEVLVSGKYLLREEAQDNNNRILDKLDDIKKEITTCMSHHNRRRGDVDPE
jgi:hypothetical protein